jgi:CrcB protein
LLVAAGGAAGAVARYGLTLFVAMFWKRDFPLATLLINVSGSFILGFFSMFAAERAVVDPMWRLLIATGFVVRTPRFPPLNTRRSVWRKVARSVGAF